MNEQTTEQELIIDLSDAPEESTQETEQEAPPAPIQTPAPPVTDDYKTQYEKMQAALKEERIRNREQIQMFEGLKTELEAYRKSRETDESQQAFEADPITAMKQELEELKQFRNETKAEREQRQKEDAHKENIRRFVVEKREEFERDTPDYHNAYAHVMDIKSKELMALGFRDQYQLNQALEFEIQRMVNHAVATNQNPAALIYQMAKATGYSNTTAQPQAKENASETLERIAAGQKAATNSGTGSKSGTNKTIRLSDIDPGKMSTKEFEAMWDDLRKKGKLG